MKELFFIVLCYLLQLLGAIMYKVSDKSFKVLENKIISALKCET